MRLFIDVSGILHSTARTVHLTDAAGSEVGVVYGTLKTLESLARKLEPTEMVLCLDRGHVARTRLFPDYKQHRRTDEEYRCNLIRQSQVLETAIWPHLPVTPIVVEGVEADDIIAELVRFTRLEPVGIVTKDQDLYQLASETDRVAIFDFQGNLAPLEFTPDQYITYKVLVGDPSDGIKGVARIGPKRARDLIYRYGSLERILAAAKLGECRLGSMDYNGVASIIQRNVDLITLDGRMLTTSERHQILTQYKTQRLTRHFNKYALQTQFMTLGFTSLLTRFPRFERAFQPLIYQHKPHINSAELKMYNSSDLTGIKRVRNVKRYTRVRRVRGFQGLQELAADSGYPSSRPRVVYEANATEGEAVPDMVKRAQQRIQKRIQQNGKTIPEFETLRCLLDLPDTWIRRQPRSEQRQIYVLMRRLERSTNPPSSNEAAFVRSMYDKYCFETPD